MPPEYSLHLVEPRDPLIARDGRPFNAEPGARASTLSFPFPSTITGGLRTRAGWVNGRFDRAKVPTVKAIEVRGPLLVELKANDTIEWYFPAPLDVVFLAAEKDETGRVVKPDRLKRLVPAHIPDGLLLGLPRHGPHSLVPTAFSETEDSDSKPASGPAFWSWPHFKAWLQNPQPILDFDQNKRAALGIKALPLDSRFHVALREDTYTSEEGQLFGTTGLGFQVSMAKGTSFKTHRMALALWSNEAKHGLSVGEGSAHLGGERRLVHWKNSSVSLPSCAEWLETIVEQRACRLTLATPAYFQKGWLPTWLLEKHPSGARPQLVSACVGRPQVVSGWDFEKRAPKPTRRLTPAGSTYFLKFDGEATKSQIRDWVEQMWLAPISDETEAFTARRDGFGLAALGVWDGEIKEGLL